MGALLFLPLAGFLATATLPLTVPQAVAVPALDPDSAPLQAAELAEAVPLLQKFYYDIPTLKDLRSVADLPALLPRLHGVAPLMPVTDAMPIRSELLPGRIGYWRIGSFAARDWKALGSELGDWNAKGVRGVILDLRHCRTTDDAFAEAARVASFFLPEGTVLFSIQALQLPQRLYQTSGAHPPFTAPLVILVDRETDGAAEVLAEVLRRQAGAIVVGRSTPGNQALCAYPKLSSGRLLRIPVAPVLLPDGTPLLGTPVAPDIAVYVDNRMEDEALAQIRLGPAARGLVENPLRHRMNEASLVHEENPEIEEVLSEQSRQNHPGDAPPLQDVTLMRAVDIVRGIALFPVATHSETAPLARTPTP